MRLFLLLLLPLPLVACDSEEELSGEHGIPTADSVVVDTTGPMIQPPPIMDSLP